MLNSDPRIMAHQQQTGSDFKIGIMGFGIGLVWIFTVATIAYFLAA